MAGVTPSFLGERIGGDDGLRIRRRADEEFGFEPELGRGLAFEETLDGSGIAFVLRKTRLPLFRSERESVKPRPVMKSRRSAMATFLLPPTLTPRRSAMWTAGARGMGLAGRDSE